MRCPSSVRHIRPVKPSTKTPGSIRTLEAPHVVLDALERHRQRQDDHAAALGSAWSNPDNLVFTSPSGRPADPKAVRNEFDRLITSARHRGPLDPEPVAPHRRQFDGRCRTAHRTRRRPTRSQRPPHAAAALPPPHQTHHRRRPHPRQRIRCQPTVTRHVNSLMAMVDPGPPPTPRHTCVERATTPLRRFATPGIC